MWSIEELGETLIEGDSFEALPKVPAESVDLVLDPMMGSGTVPLCAKTMGRRYLGIDVNPGWSLVARRRVHSAPACLSDYIHTPAAEVIS